MSGLTFTNSKWDDGQEVNVSAAEDDDLAYGTAAIGDTASGGGYGSVTGTVTAIEDDNDARGLCVTLSLCKPQEEGNERGKIQALHLGGP